MKFSEAWLREWVDPPFRTDELVARLTMVGHELDAVEPAAPPFDKVVVGAVTEVSPHPNADKLRVCRVEVGAGQPLNIVCGAPNVIAGMRVPTALEGASLPGGVSIAQTAVRGVDSMGMLCSAHELGLSEDASALLALPDDAPIGTSLRDYLGLDDTVIDLDLTPNRGDCLGVAGLAREVGALANMPLSLPPMEAVPAVVEDSLPVRLEAPAACPVYAGRIVQGISADARTPLWLSERLRRSGLRPISPVVDVTNYVMLELGQPMHAFDLRNLTGGIVVRNASAGEKLTLLDGREVTLDPGVLVIGDEAGAKALAGIMGGEDSGVAADTTDIFFESAFFAPLAVSGRARSFGLHTDASHRFERGVDPALQVRAIERATALLLAITGGQPGPVTIAREQDHLPAREPIVLRRARLARVLGLSIPDVEVESILAGLELPLEHTADGWRVTPPSFRFDLEREEDLIEEVARMCGYDRVPETDAHVQLPATAFTETRIGLSRARALLVDRGYQEAVTYSFVDAGYQALFEPERAALRLSNPIASDMAAMRVSLWPGLVRALEQNVSRQQERIRFFEYGLRYHLEDNEIKEEKRLAGVCAGNLEPEHWGTAKRAVDFYDVKGDVEALLALTGRAAGFHFQPAGHPALHPGQSARVEAEGTEVGWLGTLHPALQRQLGLPMPVFLFDLDTAAAFKASVPAFQAISRFPAIRRDLSLVVDENITAADINAVIASVDASLLRDVRLFDVYRGKGVDSGRKSISLGLILQEYSRTLTDAEADGVTQAVVRRLEQELDARIRE